MFIPNPGTFEKVLTDPIRPNVPKNVVKMPNNHLKKTFWGNSKIGDWI